MIDWDAHPREANAPARPAVEPDGVTLLEVYTVTVTEGEHLGTEAQITRAFRSRAPGRPGEHHVHAWAEDIDLGWVYIVGDDGAAIDPEAPWVQYDLDARCASLRRHDERGTRRPADPTGDINLTPLGRNPSWGA